MKHGRLQGEKGERDVSAGADREWREGAMMSCVVRNLIGKVTRGVWVR